MNSKEPTEEHKMPVGQSDDYHTKDRGGGGQGANLQLSVSSLDAFGKDVEDRAIAGNDGAKTGANIKIIKGNESILNSPLVNDIVEHEPEDKDNTAQIDNQKVQKDIMSHIEEVENIQHPQTVMDKTGRIQN